MNLMAVEQNDIACAVGMATSIPVGGGSLDAAAFAKMCSVITTEAGIKRFRQEVALRDALVPDAARAIQARYSAILIQKKARS